jgi:YD repeat-containing protein
MNAPSKPVAEARPAQVTVATAGTDSQQLTWNEEGKLGKSTDKTGATSFVYDADGARLVRRDPTGDTLSLPDGSEIRSPGSSTVTTTPPSASPWPPVRASGSEP